MKIDPGHMTQPDWLVTYSITNYKRDLQQLQGVECLLCSPLANLVYCYVRLCWPVHQAAASALVPQCRVSVPPVAFQETAKELPNLIEVWSAIPFPTFDIYTYMYSMYTQLQHL